MREDLAELVDIMTDPYRHFIPVVEDNGDCPDTNEIVPDVTLEPNQTDGTDCA